MKSTNSNHIHKWKKIFTNYDSEDRPFKSTYECEDPECRELKEENENVQLLLSL